MSLFLGDPMYVCRSIICLLFFCLTASYSARSQTATSQIPTTFQLQAQSAASAGKPFSAVNFTATAEWTAGSLHESGTAQLRANVDGSNNIQLALGKASRTEVQTKTDSSRTCTWTDSAGKSREILGPNCLVAIPWFAPGLFVQPPVGLPALLGTTDDGVISKGSATFHRVSYLLKLKGKNAAATTQMVSQSTVKVFYDPQTFLPASLEYSIHPDNDDSQDIPVKVGFTNYQSVSGVMLPFHIERYVNRTLQLKLDVSNASIE
jgi:hypothetical protein